MSVSENEILQTKDYLISHGAKRVILFGSALHSPDKANDLDIACEGIPPEKFYTVAGGVGRLLRREIDLVDLTDNTPFTKHIEKTGRVIHHVS